jgi:hypothetical protein
MPDKDCMAIFLGKSLQESCTKSSIFHKLLNFYSSKNILGVNYP